MTSATASNSAANFRQIPRAAAGIPLSTGHSPAHPARDRRRRRPDGGSSAPARAALARSARPHLCPSFRPGGTSRWQAGPSRVKEHSCIRRETVKRGGQIARGLERFKSPSLAVAQMVFNAGTILAVHRLHRRPVDQRPAQTAAELLRQMALAALAAADE